MKGEGKRDVSTKPPERMKLQQAVERKQKGQMKTKDFNLIFQ